MVHLKKGARAFTGAGSPNSNNYEKGLKQNEEQIFIMSIFFLVNLRHLLQRLRHPEQE